MSFEIKDNVLLKYTGEAEAKEVVIPDGVKRIGEFAFFQCKIESITIPESVTEIHPTAFLGYRSFKKVNASGKYAVGIQELLRASRVDYNYAKCTNCSYRLYCGLFSKFVGNCEYQTLNFSMKERILQFNKTRSYTSSYSDHESGQDLYTDEYTTYKYEIPKEVPEDTPFEEVLLYALSHLGDWKRTVVDGDEYF